MNLQEAYDIVLQDMMEMSEREWQRSNYIKHNLPWTNDPLKQKKMDIIRRVNDRYKATNGKTSFLDMFTGFDDRYEDPDARDTFRELKRFGRDMMDQPVGKNPTKEMRRKKAIEEHFRRVERR